MVARVQNASGNSFDVKLDRADGQTGAVTGIDVHYMVVEEGVYTLAEHGVKMEAVKFTSTRTDNNKSWVGESRSYQQSYTSPVVVGQVMSYNDPDWSVFWTRGSDKKAPPSSSTLYVGKHVGEDADKTRSNETIGYVVVESGMGMIGDIGFEAGLGTDSIKGVDDAPSYDYTLSGTLPSFSAAVASQAAMDGGNGGWAVLYGTDPASINDIHLAIDEDRMKDSERKHTTEQVAYIVFDPPAEAASATSPTSLSPAAADLALLAWVDADSSDDEDTDILATQAADELALMLFE